MNSISRSLSRIVYSSVHPPRRLPAFLSITSRESVILRRIHITSSLNKGRDGGGGSRLKLHAQAKAAEDSGGGSKLKSHAQAKPAGDTGDSSKLKLHAGAKSAEDTGDGSKLESQPQAISDDVTETEKELARPREISYQSEVANWVNLIGFVDQPVQFEASSDGKFWAGTVISQRSSRNSVSDSSAFWIPIIFEGDLARTAARYLKKDDQVHISGKLFIDSPPPNIAYAQANIQVMVQNLDFIRDLPLAQSDSTSDTQEVLPKKRSVKNAKDSKRVPLAKNNSASETQEAVPKKRPSKKVTEEASDSWRGLLDNPQEWWDYRDNKKNGLVKPRHPDYKRKDGGLSLWLNKAPEWVLSELEGVEFDIPVSKTKPTKQQKGDESWEDLVRNPEKWWDNRSDKKNVKAPDFKHKETGEALWLNVSPTWVLSKLPPLKKNHQEEPIGRKE